MNKLWPAGPKRMIWSLLRRSPLRERDFSRGACPREKCLISFVACEPRTLRGLCEPKLPERRRRSGSFWIIHASMREHRSSMVRMAITVAPGQTSGGLCITLSVDTMGVHGADTHGNSVTDTFLYLSRAPMVSAIYIYRVIYTELKEGSNRARPFLPCAQRGFWRTRERKTRPGSETLSSCSRSPPRRAILRRFCGFAARICKIAALSRRLRRAS